MLLISRFSWVADDTKIITHVFVREIRWTGSTAMHQSQAPRSLVPPLGEVWLLGKVELLPKVSK